MRVKIQTGCDAIIGKWKFSVSSVYISSCRVTRLDFLSKLESNENLEYHTVVEQVEATVNSEQDPDLPEEKTKNLPI